MTRKQKLELTWIGKQRLPRLEPRILREDHAHSYHAGHRIGANDVFDNQLIFGDNLLALKALEQQFAGSIRCVLIDPPFNTGQAFEHYDDGVEHSLWLTLMRDRIEILRRLLSPTGSLWIVIDENEAHYLKVLCDELFGRDCFVATVIWKANDNSKNDAKTFSSDHNHILVYSRSADWSPNFLNDPEKRKHFKNPDNDPKGPWFDGNPLNSPAVRPNLQFDLKTPSGNLIKPPPKGWRWSYKTILEKVKTGEIRYSEDETRIIRRTYLRDMKGLPPSSLWANIDETGHNRQAKYELKNLFPDVEVSDLFGTPKPERLCHKILSLATDPGDIVLDSFAGSGTTGAVAHKMGRKWIMVELGEHCHSYIIPRLKKVIDGSDSGGVTELVGWGGGGGFRYFTLAPSLLEIDPFGNWIISKNYNREMVAEAMCKLEGFKYAPSDDVFWQHGHSTESDFIYVTTQTLTREQLQRLSDEVGPERSLLICCGAFRVRRVEDFPNLTIRKIPKAVMAKCEWGKDDYSLQIRSLPALAEQQPQDVAVEGAPENPRKRRKLLRGQQELSLFAKEGTE